MTQRIGSLALALCIVAVELVPSAPALAGDAPTRLETRNRDDQKDESKDQDSNMKAADSLTTLAVVRTRRFIKMIYTLDLQKDNALSPAIAAVMRANEAEVRACYTSRLEENPQLRGELGLRVQLSGASGKVQRVAPIKGGLTDRKLLLCVARALVRMPLNAPKTTKGTLVFRFDVLDDQHVD